jgi:RNA polymerase sigma factor (sigma-70 family)
LERIAGLASKKKKKYFELINVQIYKYYWHSLSLNAELILSKYSTHITDEELVQIFCAEADKSALGELFNRYQHLVVSICYKYFQERELAKDAMMQIFEKLMVDLPKQDIQYFKAWLHTVSKNYCLMQLRKAKLPTKHVENIENYDMENDEGLHLAIEKEINITKMYEAIAQIDDKQRLCINLFYLKKKSYADIQAQTGFTFMEVKSFIQNGKRKLKLLMS